MSPENPNDKVTRADLDKQLEVHAKTIELQILLSQQQERILEKLDEHEDVCKGNKDLIEKNKDILEKIDRRTWKQNWLFWGLIGSLLTTAATIITKLLVSGS